MFLLARKEVNEQKSSVKKSKQMTIIVSIHTLGVTVKWSAIVAKHEKIYAKWVVENVIV